MTDIAPKTDRTESSAEPATGTRAAIFEAAYDEFAEKGRSGASMRAIARRAGCTQSLVHHHFGSKNDLWEAASRDIAKLWFKLSSDFLDDPEPDAASVVARRGDAHAAAPGEGGVAVEHLVVEDEAASRDDHTAGDTDAQLLAERGGGHADDVAVRLISD